MPLSHTKLSCKRANSKAKSPSTFKNNNLPIIKHKSRYRRKKIENKESEPN